MSVPEILQALQSVQASFETQLSVTNSLLQELMNTFDYHFSRLQPQNPNSTHVLPKLNPTFQIATPLPPVIDEESGFLPQSFTPINFVVSSSQLAPQLQPQNPLLTMTTKTQFCLSHPLSSTPKPPLPSPSEFKEQQKLYHKGNQKRPQLRQCHSRFLRLVGTEDMCDSESTERAPGAVIIFVYGHQIRVREPVMLCGEPPPQTSLVSYNSESRSYEGGAG